MAYLYIDIYKQRRHSDLATVLCVSGIHASKTLALTRLAVGTSARTSRIENAQQILTIYQQYVQFC